MRHLIAAVCAFVLMPLAASAAAPIESGSYNDAMLVGYDPATGVISGYFEMRQDGPPTISCIFYLHGKLGGGTAAIRTYFPETPKDVIGGTLAVKDPKDFSISLKTEPGGCGNLEPFGNEGDPEGFDLAAAYPWTSVAVVKSAKAYLYASPSAAAHGRAYLVQGDGVGVRAAQSGWRQVDYVGGTKDVSGWLKASDLYPAP
jgi:hypothetical protein